ncbi:MAG: ribosome biogenesis GTPase YlqF [Anaeromicrobium sp.]|jgi:ribosome biogenesis GTPase A|uniref:ribosome biogenesis GTPase YlqF n=1 Tax=Anaeromicrobium sp. TaxID=1929132 RepID=UPI0025F85E8C|nr:ribosome biogenesis GTPase YlqF [Anaeromicrobium sp.]MCT4594960.1 ribosome biogenesis GTPase YlqF [Anaeromicrobium sp.]
MEHINWYPGHMKKTKELIQKNLKLVDVVIELVDARNPLSSRNPQINEIVQNKPKVIVLNKSDLANPAISKEWVEYFKKEGYKVVEVDTISGKGLDKVTKMSNEAVEDKMKAREEKGMNRRAIRAMIVGIPNVGKSSIINRLTGKKSAKTGDRPGVTKGKQWVRLKGNIELLDTPGVLWPKFEDLNVGLKLAFTGSIKDEVLDVETVALRLIEYLCRYYPDNIKERYKLDTIEEEPLDNMENIAKKRGCILGKGRIDYTRVANIILDEFRASTIGRISLERPNEEIHITMNDTEE